MEAHELRIGNLVTVDNSIFHPNLLNIPLKVTGIAQIINNKKESTHAIGLEHINQEKNTYYESYSQFIKFIKPIPLIEEWMVKFGGKNKTGWYGLDFEIEVFDQTVEFTFELMDGVLTFYANELPIMTRETPYVHQLQNLYFALTGKERKIK